ncbi:sensor histidine kinase [Arenibacter sp. F26102]|uniref:sensor histidine kinase n=1 Tax=Arenibacter sp. F26102 TaxID=2926416 RepID=UPI001FF3D3FE|nr:sensor histidine kinase [Arenibacter sp. F26102]MCK0146196.1 sensor histidine kinase [Arenibacter sp. F26102]
MVLDKKNIPQWLVHAFLWLTLFGLLSYPFLSGSGSLPYNLLAKLLVAMALFYLNYYYLVPKLLLKDRMWNYIVLSVLLLLAIGFFANIAFPPSPPDNFPRRAVRMHPPGEDGPGAFRFFLMTTVIFAVPYIFGTMLKVYTEWQKNEDLRKLVEKEKIQSELQFLKTQLNPHFLFNSLNTIYSLSVKQSPDTSEAVINLSELMRYMLYEADRKLVPLDKEVEYIKSYVALQRLRLSNSEEVTLKISGEERGKLVPPLLFISFIENAFKYGTDYNGKSFIKINLSVNHESIHLQVINIIGSFKAETNSSGVGLENVKNRLNYLYPNSHELLIVDDGKTYEVNLTLKLKNYELHNH